MNPATLEQARAAKAKAVELYGDLPEVVGVGIAPLHGGYVVQINLKEHSTNGPRLPTAIDQVPLRASVVGRIEKA
jgi:hypothetical protein